MIRIREIKAINRTVETTPGEILVIFLHDLEVLRVRMDRTQRISHVATIEIGNAIGHVVGDETLEADLKKMAAVQWTDRDLVDGFFDNLRDRMPGPQGPQKLGL